MHFMATLVPLSTTLRSSIYPWYVYAVWAVEGHTSFPSVSCHQFSQVLVIAPSESPALGAGTRDVTSDLEISLGTLDHDLVLAYGAATTR